MITGDDVKKYKLRCKLSYKVEEIDRWLINNCDGEYDFNFEGIVETGSVFNQIEILFSFENPKDRDKFKDAVKTNTI